MPTRSKSVDVTSVQRILGPAMLIGGSAAAVSGPAAPVVAPVGMGVGALLGVVGHFMGLRTRQMAEKRRFLDRLLNEAREEGMLNIQAPLVERVDNLIDDLPATIRDRLDEREQELKAARKELEDRKRLDDDARRETQKAA